MSEEEKDGYIYLSQAMFDDETTEKYVNILLNLIDRQQKEIEELKEVKWYYEISRVPKDKIRELINKRNAGIGYTSLECIEDIEELLED